MAEKVTAGPITSANGVREAVCIHTKKIFSSCKDKDCIEDLTFYPTATAQSVIDASQSIRGGRVELLHVGVDVEPVSFNRGFFTVDMRFYYRVILQAVNNGMRATEIEGLATFDKRVMLFGGESRAKDQSYVLYSLTQDQLAHTKFPLGGMDKPSIRKIAEEQGFCNARKHDSQDICFVPDGDYVGFMERYTGKYYPDGDFLDVNGNVVGRHHGAVRYTCGQRKGLGLALGAPVYVCGKDMEKNTVTVGPESELFKTTLIAGDFNWISVPELTAPMRVKAKARYRQVEQPATAYPLENGLVKVVFDEPQRAITRGQAVVLYDGDVVVGGGTIL